MRRAARVMLLRWQTASRGALARIEVLTLFPILALAAHLFGGAEAVLAASLVLPALLVVQNLQVDMPGGSGVLRGRGAVRPDRQTLTAMLDRIAAMPGMDTACLVLEIDDWNDLTPRWGEEAAQDVRDACLYRLRSALRGDDLVADLSDGRFGVVLHPIAAARLEVRNGIADRLRAAIGAPLGLGATTLRLTACMGHAGLTRPDGAGTLGHAIAALQEAQGAGPGSVRAYVTRARDQLAQADPLAEEVPGALASGAIEAWFQPQLDAASGALTGLEALARWRHPTLGLLGPGRFLAAVEAAGAMTSLGTVIRRQALAVLPACAARGAGDITVSVNACTAELRNPAFAAEVAWDIDATDMAPHRLIVEVLETVAAETADDTIMATLAELRRQGIGLDLDDFGVGQASLLSIRRFGVQRIKIDRAFVLGIDSDPEQRAMVGGILSLAREMGLATLAEGVETPEEMAALRSMGCDYLQGYAIAKPMAPDDLVRWVARHVSASPETGDPGRSRPAAPGRVRPIDIGAG